MTLLAATIGVMTGPRSRPPQKVQIFSIADVAPKRGSTRKRYRVRWRVDGRTRGRTFNTRAEADRYRSTLHQAVNAGERFDLESGEPVGWQSATPSWFEWSLQYLAVKWPQWAGTTRRSAVETLVAITPLMVDRRAAAPPDDLTAWLRTTGYVPPFDAIAPPWLRRWSLPLDAIEPSVVERVLTAVTTRKDQRPMSATVVRRRRNALGAIFRSAMRRGLLDHNPLDRIEWRSPTRDDTLDIATVPSVDEVHHLVEHVASKTGAAARYAAFFGCVGLAGMRPSEVAALELEDLELPAAGWGLATVRGAVTEPGTRYTDEGDSWERKGLKHRSRESVREVPLPPSLVRVLTAHIDRFDVRGGAVFTTTTGTPPTTGVYQPVWKAARERLWPEGHALATVTVYGLRHSAATTMLSAGVSPAEVARRLGHSIDVLLRIYAGVTSDERERANALLTLAFDGPSQ